MTTTPKILILIRHAHRDTTSKKADNGLSERGHQQAIRLKSELKEKVQRSLKEFKSSEPQNPNPLLILSSPKKRCIETIKPLADEFKMKIQIEPLLHENSHDENYSEFIQRIQDFIHQWKEKGPSITLACSHGDWLPEATRMLVGQEIDYVKSGWASFIFSPSPSPSVKLQESCANRNY